MDKKHRRESRLIAYSDTAQGHNGTIYKAANWKQIATIKYPDDSLGWSNRPNRRGMIGGDKLKFERVIPRKKSLASTQRSRHATRQDTLIKEKDKNAKKTR